MDWIMVKILQRRECIPWKIPAISYKELIAVQFYFSNTVLKMLHLMKIHMYGTGTLPLSNISFPVSCRISLEMSIVVDFTLHTVCVF